MHRPKIALVVVDLKDVPEWVPPELKKIEVEFVARNCTNMEDFLACVSDAFLIWTMGICEFITPEVLPKLKSCKYIMRSGSGLDSLPIKEAAALDIQVTNTPESISNSVAEHTVSLLLALAKQVVNYDKYVRAGNWYLKEGWDSWHISGQTLGLVGFGFIARRVAELMSGFGVKVLCCDPYANANLLKESHVTSVNMDRLLSESDFISLHCPLNDSTFHLIGEKEFKTMKKSALLINTSRGAVIDEKALFAALKNKWICGAAIDVTEKEPVEKNNSLLELENLIITPHIAAWDDVFDRNFWEGSVKKIKELTEEYIFKMQTHQKT